MVSAIEGAGGRGQMAAGLALGLETLSQNQTITFTRYHRLVLPMDGFVFWVKADLLTPSALLNSSPASVRRPRSNVANTPFRRWAKASK